MAFSELFNAMMDPPKHVPARKQTLPDFAKALKDPELGVKIVLHKEAHMRRAWWREHARLKMAGDPPCNMMCEIINNA
eukprot:CAMPEP_0184300866 /NCGR_PEP_ID=MMETSP1049-20130417/11198_1 /TAXON_ID=77928 /ORGANISM="Proteomonas sulcata, Strain CCMP704" /LENGTH=77 /DNA_ID=CAMNT_0026611705 /DNA_START=22 /DNA_END=255 /DNA_ORIENTATION=-